MPLIKAGVGIILLGHKPWRGDPVNLASSHASKEVSFFFYVTLFLSNNGIDTGLFYDADPSHS